MEDIKFMNIAKTLLIPNDKMDFQDKEFTIK
jgi:hypothetical protein